MYLWIVYAKIEAKLGYQFDDIPACACLPVVAANAEDALRLAKHVMCPPPSMAEGKKLVLEAHPFTEEFTTKFFLSHMLHHGKDFLAETK